MTGQLVSYRQPQTLRLDGASHIQIPHHPQQLALVEVPHFVRPNNGLEEGGPSLETTLNHTPENVLHHLQSWDPD